MDVTGGSLNYKMGFDYSELLKGAKQVLAALGDVDAAMSAFGKIDDWTEVTKESVTIQKQYIKDLEKQYEELGEQIAKISDGPKKESLLKQYKEIGDEIQSEKDNLLDMEDAVRANELSTARLQVQYRNVVAQMQNLAKAGMQDTEEYKALANQAENLKEAMQGVNNELKPQNTALMAMASGITTITGAMSAAMGVVTLFGERNEKLNEIMAKMQSLMAITVGLQQVSTNLTKESNLMLGINAMQRAAAAKAQAVLNVETGKYVITTKSATVAQRAFNAVANANPYVLLATAIITVVGALVAFTRGTKEAKKQEEELQRATDEARKKQEEFNQKISDSASTMIASYKTLQTQWEKLSSEKEKNKWIKEHKNLFEELGVAINNVADAENVLTKNSDAVIQSLMLRAKASAYAALAVEKYKEAINLELKGQEELKKKGAVKAGDIVGSDRYKNDIYAERNGNNEWVYTEKGAQLKNTTMGGMLSFFSSDKADELVKKEQELLAEANKILKDAGIDTVRIQEETDNRYLAELKKAQERAQDLQLANEEDNAETRKKKIEVAFTRQIEEAEVNAANAAKPDLKKAYEDQAKELRTAMKKAIEAVDNEEKQKKKATLDEILGYYADYNARRKQIEEQYTQDIKVLQDKANELPEGSEERLRLEKAIAEALRQQQEELLNLDVEYGEINQINKDIARLENEKVVAVGQGDTEEVKRLNEELRKLQQRLKKFEQQSNSKSFETWLKGLDAEDFIKTGEAVAEVLSDIGKASDNKALQDIGSSLQVAGNVAAKVASSDYLGAVLTVFSEIGKTLADDIAKTKQYSDAIKQATEEANLLRIALLLDEQDSIFGSVPIDNVERYTKALNKAKEALDRYKEEAEALNTVWSAYASNNYAMSNFNNKVFTVADYSGFANSLGIADKYDTLQDFAERMNMDLYDSYGNLSADVLKLFEKTYQYLSEEDKQWIDQAIEYSDKYAEAMEGLCSYLESIFGNTVDTLVDQLFDGTVDMEKIVSDAGEQMAKDLMKSLIMAQYFEGLKEKMQAIITQNGGMTDRAAAEIFGLYTEAMANFNNDLPQWQALAEKYKESFDFLDESASSTSGVGLSGSSQESIDLMNGQLNAMRTVQGRIENTIQSILLEMRGFRSDVNDRFDENNRHLEQLIDNTSQGGSIVRGLGAYLN